MDLGHPTLDQALFARFLERGDYDRHLRRCQRAYRQRRDTLVAALEEHFPGAAVTGIAAGLHVIAELPEKYGPGPQDDFLERWPPPVSRCARSPPTRTHARVPTTPSYGWSWGTRSCLPAGSVRVCV
jgi:hypothetical protein